jgi:hypothetical protein
VDIDVCTDFKLLEVKVPLIFLGMVGFSARRDGRYRDYYNHTAADQDP